MQLQPTQIDAHALTIAQHIAVRQNRLGASRLDLASEASLALLESGQRFDPTRGASLTTFAYARIQGRAQDAIRAEAKYLRAREERQRHTPVAAGLTVSERLDVWRTVDRVVADLPTVERAVLDSLYRQDQPLRELAERGAWSEDQLQRAHQKLLHRLRSAAQARRTLP